MNPLIKGLLDKTVLVVGCGGLGCNVVEYLSRSQISRLIILDGDIFEPNNLNRQLYCNTKTLGRYKVMVASEKIAEFSDDTLPITIDENFPTQLLDRYNDYIDVIVDCLDNVESRLKLEEYATAIGVPLVHGAINGTTGQVTTVFPNDGTLAKLYSNMASETVETLAFVPSLVASLQAAEVIKVLNDKPTLRGELLLIDLMEATFNKVKI